MSEQIRTLYLMIIICLFYRSLNSATLLVFVIYQLTVRDSYTRRKGWEVVYPCSTPGITGVLDNAM